jgi:transposase
MITKELFQMALNVTDPWYVKDLEFDSEAKRLDIYIDFKKGSTFSHSADDETELIGLKAYDTKEKTWRHLNFFEHECYLHARVPRVRLPDGKVKLISTPWEGLSNGFTLLFEALLMQLVSAMPVKKVADIAKVSDDKLWDMIDRYIEKTRVHEDFSDVTAIGLDETSRAKGHEYITLFVDLKERRTINITTGKDSATVKDFAEDLEAHSGSVAAIRDVSCDMSPAFTKGVKEHLPEAKITYDKFHIIKLINEAVDKVRRAEVVEAKILKGTRYVFLKNEKNLTKKQTETLQRCTLSNMNLKTVRAYNIKTAFQEIYGAKTKEEFVTYLNKWYFWATHSRLEPIKKVAYTIKRHWDGVINYHESNINNGILEGLNSVIQAAKSKARGYKTFRNYKNIVYLLTGKLDFSLVNCQYREI